MKSVKLKLILSFLVVTLVYSVILTGTILGTRSINNSYEELLGNQVTTQNNLQLIIQHSQEQALAIRGQLIQNKEEYNEQFLTATNEIDLLIEQTTPLLHNKEQVNRLNEIAILNATFLEKYDDFTKRLAAGETPEQLTNYWKSDLLPIGISVREQSTAFWADIEQQVNTQIDENLIASERITKNIVTTSIIVLTLVLLFSYFISRLIARPIQLVTAATEKLAQGDLTEEPVTIKSRDELQLLATTFNNMQSAWRKIVNNIYDNSNQVASAANQLMTNAEQTAKSIEHITQAVQDIAMGAKSTESYIEENKRALEEMTIGVTRVAEATSSVAQISEQTRTISSNGRQSIEQVMNQMEQINRSTNETADVIESLNSRSSEIVSIIKVITDISEQTNLLSLNAAIEAARAGEQGKGFAVVADEVRKLAEQSHRSAETITDLISDIQSDTQKAVSSMQKGSEDVAYGIKVVKVADEGFEAINSSVETLAAQIEDITAISEQMSASAEELLASMEEILNISQLSTNNSENVAAASEQQLAVIQEVNASVANLTQLADSLRKEISHFKINN